MSEAADSEEQNGRERTDPYRRHQFVVDVDGLPEVGFTEITGLEVTVEPRATRSTNDPEGRRLGDWRRFVDRVVDRPSPSRQYETSSPNLELQRGVTDDVVLWDWLQDWVDGRTEPRTVGVYLVDGAGDAAVGWVCRAARPVKWTGPKLNADKSGIAMETLELEHGGIHTTTEISLDAP
jgi:phage tail-like protein